MDLRPTCASLFLEHLRAKLRASRNGIGVSLVKPRGYRIPDSACRRRHVARTYPDRNRASAMDSHGGEGTIGRSVRYADKAAEPICVRRNHRVHVARIRGGNDHVARSDVSRSEILTLLDGQLPLLGRFQKFSRYFRRDDSHCCAGCTECQRLTCPDGTSSDNQRGNFLAIERDRQRRQRNCPLFSATTRNTT